MRGWIGVTESRWIDHLKAHPENSEANFWRPSSHSAPFKALSEGEPFLFKTKYSAGDSIVGGGFFSGYQKLRLSEAWKFWGTANGADNFEEWLELMNKTAPTPLIPARDPEIGCIMLSDIFFLEEESQIPNDNLIAKQVVQGKGFSLESGSKAEAIFTKALTGNRILDNTASTWSWDAPIFGQTSKSKRRLGQGAFQARILDAYNMKCAITKHKIRPTLQAAHIKPVQSGGIHRTDNGLLLRSDIHTLFDSGYIAVDHDFRINVSPRIREEFGNGDELYAIEGSLISLPSNVEDRPNHEFIEWHLGNTFLG